MQFHVTIYDTRVFTHMLREVSIVQLDTWVSGRLGKDESTDRFHTSNESFTLFIKSPATSCRHSQALIVSDPDASQSTLNITLRNNNPLCRILLQAPTVCVRRTDRTSQRLHYLSVESTFAVYMNNILSQHNC